MGTTSSTEPTNQEESKQESSQLKPSPSKTRAKATPSAKNKTNGAAEAKPRAKRSSTRKPAADTPPAANEPSAISRPRLLERYNSDIKTTLQSEFGYKNVMEIPQIRKVVVNIGLAESKQNPRAVDDATADLQIISAQRPVTTRARKSIANFKLREGDPIGTMVTIRGQRMYHFLDKLFNASLPRIRDFRGASRKAFDGNGNYSLGLRDQTIFPEIDYGQVNKVRGMQISIITSTDKDEDAMRLLELLGMPFTRVDQ
jgi:large subunit ribosomal protein L5